MVLGQAELLYGLGDADTMSALPGLRFVFSPNLT
jgi:hypothetical protein